MVIFIRVFAEIMRKMGEVFLLRANIAAVGSVLDSPEVFWVIIVFCQGYTTDEPRPVVSRPATAL
jgi:hypothetical protein